MGSVFVTDSDKVIKGFAGKKYSVPIYLQFVPGVCVEAVHSVESLSYTGPNTINTIIAIPHVSKKLYKKKALARRNEQHRYYPLLRTMHDLPSSGDPVLLCTIGKINYYLGPLNSMENNPTWNDDPSYTPELNLDLDYDLGGVSEEGKRGETGNFNKELLFSRLQKKRKLGLDYGSVVGETTGDTIIEGRHGNSLRIGSRSDNPYVFISNQRMSTNDFESLADGSLISIISSGTLTQHLGDDSIDDFKLASDTVTTGNADRFMGKLVSSVNGNVDSDIKIYKYGSIKTDKLDFDGAPIYRGINANQILFNSDRIIINSKKDDIYLSSINDIHIGTGRHLTISTNENLIIESKNTFLGNPTPNGKSRQMDSLVLGDSLILILEELLDTLGATTSTMYFPIPLAVAGTPLKNFMDNLKNKLAVIKSNKHFIEPN